MFGCRGVQHLKDRRMLGIHGNHHAAGPFGRAQQGGTCADQAFLVGEGDDRPGPSRSQRWGQSCKADDRRHHPLRFFCGNLLNGLRTRCRLDAGPLQTLAQLRQLGLVFDDGHPGAPTQGLLGQPRHIAPGRQSHDLQLDPGSLKQVKGRRSDRACRSQNCNLARQAQCPHPN